MKVIKSITVFYMLIFSITFSCTAKQDYMHTYLQSLSEEIDVVTLANFKKSEIDPEGKTIGLIYNDVKQSINQLEKEDQIYIYLDSISKEEKVKTTFIVLALHHYCNNEPIEFEQIRKEFYTIQHFEQMLESRRDNIEIQKRVQENDQLFKIGDTITAYFVVGSDFGQKNIVYNRWLSDSTYYEQKNMVKLTGVVNDKYYNTQPHSGADSAELIFNCDLIKVSDKDVYYSDIKLKRGVNINISLTSYGRLLRKE